jgi:two-component system OmpR family response regulator
LRILVIEDDESSANYIAKSFKQHGHVVDTVYNGREGLFQAAGDTYDVMVIDRMLPGLDGLGIIKTIRSTGVKSPIIVLTAMTGIDDRVEGLNAGADDYMVKPFAFAELLARVNALARRSPHLEDQNILIIDNLEMDLIRHKVSRGGRSVDLQPQEYRLLEYLMRHPDRVMTRAMLLENVWDFHFDPKTSVVETHISRLRNKITLDGEKQLIHTVRGAGYQLSATK